MTKFRARGDGHVNAKNDLVRIGGAVLGAVAIAAGGLFVPAAIADATTAETAADELPPFAVEDFNYPGADRILEERGFLLKRGDGHIVLADCAAENVLTVSARGLGNEDVCFRVTGDEGFLTLELVGAYLVHTNDYPTTQLETTAEGETETFEFGPNEWGPIGESTDDREHVLVEIRVSR
jgi:hypothetical protein